MRKIGMLCFMLVSMIGCQSDDKEAVKGNDTPVAVDFETIRQGDLINNLLAPGNYTLRTIDQWVGFQNRAKIFDDIRFDSDNYDVYEVFAVLDEPKESTGYSIEIKSIFKIDGKLIVTVERHNPELGKEVTKRVSQAYHLVKLKKTGLPVVFK